MHTLPHAHITHTHTHLLRLCCRAERDASSLQTQQRGKVTPDTDMLVLAVALAHFAFFAVVVAVVVAVLGAVVVVGGFMALAVRKGGVEFAMLLILCRYREREILRKKDRKEKKEKKKNTVCCFCTQMKDK